MQLSMTPFHIAFVVGGIAFAISASLALVYGGRRGTRPLVCVISLGLTFPFWAWVLFQLPGGIWGWPHAALTAIVLVSATGSRWVWIVPLVAIGPAWVPMYIGSGWPGSPTLPVVIWNLVVAGGLFLWAAIERRAATTPGLCETCGYPVHDLPEPVCPECGSAVPLGSSRSVPAAHPHHEGAAQGTPPGARPCPSGAGPDRAPKPSHPRPSHDE